MTLVYEAKYCYFLDQQYFFRNVLIFNQLTKVKSFPLIKFTGIYFRSVTLRTFAETKTNLARMSET